MSYIFKCDICGKDSAMTNVQFTPEPLVVQINTYDNKKMNISMSIIMEDAEDTDNIDRMSALLNDVIMKRTLENGGEDPSGLTNPEELFQDAVFENMGEFVEEFGGKLTMVDNAVGLQLNTPNPMICNTCKRDMAYQALTKGVHRNIPSKIYSTDSVRMHPLDMVTEEPPLLPEKPEILCIDCGKKLKKETKTGKCRECYLKSSRKGPENGSNDEKSE